MKFAVLSLKERERYGETRLCENAAQKLKLLPVIAHVIDPIKSTAVQSTKWNSKVWTTVDPVPAAGLLTQAGVLLGSLLALTSLKVRSSTVVACSVLLRNTQLLHALPLLLQRDFRDTCANAFKHCEKC